MRLAGSKGEGVTVMKSTLAEWHSHSKGQGVTSPACAGASTEATMVGTECTGKAAREEVSKVTGSQSGEGIMVCCEGSLSCQGSFHSLSESPLKLAN